MNSPISTLPAKFLKNISASSIVDKYQRELNLDIKKFIDQVDSIELWECNETGYRFFMPVGIAGDGSFYEALSKSFENYYEVEKWEHDLALAFIKKSTSLQSNEVCSILEIGCAEGEFLSWVKKQIPEIETYGIDINEDAINKATRLGLKASLSTIESYSSDNSNKFDFVVCFQVLEHISDVSKFLNGAVNILKPGGKLVIAVPNSDSYILKNDGMHTLNLPPHHMGWWNETSLTSLTDYLPIKMISVQKEPTDFSHIGEYYKAFLNNLFGKSSAFLYPITRSFIKPIFKKVIGKNEGMSILSIYEKK